LDEGSTDMTVRGPVAAPTARGDLFVLRAAILADIFFHRVSPSPPLDSPSGGQDQRSQNQDEGYQLIVGHL
jgi:hypothetical protein